jgi:hypothetical protein
MITTNSQQPHISPRIVSITAAPNHNLVALSELRQVAIGHSGPFVKVEIAKTEAHIFMAEQWLDQFYFGLWQQPPHQLVLTPADAASLIWRAVRI